MTENMEKVEVVQKKVKLKFRLKSGGHIEVPAIKVEER